MELLSQIKNTKMRPYILGEDLSLISVSTQDIPEVGGMVAVNENNPNDMWYVGKDFFENNYILVRLETGLTTYYD